MKVESKNDLIKTDICNQILTGALSPGQAIETDAALSKKYGVSRMTVRKAIDELVLEGYLTRVYKKGAFVNRRSRLEGFRFGFGYSEEMRKRGMEPSSREVIVKLEEPSAREIEDLQLKFSHRVWHVNRLRLADGVPIAYEDSFFPYPLVEELTLEDAQGSILEALQLRYGYTFHSVDQWIDAVSADAKLSRALEVPVGTPLVRTFTVSYLPNGTPINSGYCMYRTDNFKLIQSVHA